MERLSLTHDLDIKDFNDYIGKFPGVVLKVETKSGIKEYHLATDQIVEIPYIESIKYDKLIFGKNQEEGIVNVTYKQNKMYVYFQDGSSKVIDYKPYCLSSVITGSGKRLIGNQHYKYITSLTDDRYNEMKDSWHRNFWFPRSIEEGFMILNGHTYFKGLKVKDISYLSFDIENQNENEADPDELVVIISNTFRDREGNYTRKLFDINEYNGSSIAMVEAWCAWVREINPDVLTGHNIFIHDLPILNMVTPLKLGRDDSFIEFEEKASKFRKDGQQQYEYHNAHIHGREIVDTWMLSIKYDNVAKEFPSYGLKVIEQHLKIVTEDRIEWDFTVNPVRDTMHNPELWNKFILYAKDDSDSPLKLVDIMLPSLFYFNQSVPKTLQQMINEATGSQLDAIMIRSYLQDGNSQPKTSNKVPFEGAVSIGVPGVYDYVKKIDVASLYPSIMLQYNIYDKTKDPNKHLIKILNYFRDERLRNKKTYKETKDTYFDDLQNSQKIAINSMYGFLGAGYLLYNYPEGAAAVTRYGREIILKTTEWATGHTLVHDIKKITNEGGDNEEIEYEWVVGPKVCEGKGYTLVNGDTDSIAYTNGKPFDFQDYLNEVKEINGILPELINFEDDGVYKRVVVIRAKNYALLPDAAIKDGQKKVEENLKKYGTEYSLKGSAFKDQKKEKALREFISKMINCLVYNEESKLVDIYHKYVCESQNIEDINRWATKKTVTSNVLNGKRKNETKVVDAISNERVQEGDKIYVFQKIEGEIPKLVKGEPQYYKKTGLPVMVPNKILKLAKNWVKGEENKDQYLLRVYDTLLILEKVIDKTQFIDYTLVKNKKILQGLLNGSVH